MRKALLFLVIAAASLGLVGLMPARAQAWHGRYYAGYYYRPAYPVPVYRGYYYPTYHPVYRSYYVYPTYYPSYTSYYYYTPPVYSGYYYAPAPVVVTPGGVSYHGYVSW